jgi:hypothetical protein
MPAKTLLAVLIGMYALSAHADSGDHRRDAGALLQGPTQTLSVSAAQFTAMLANGGASGRALLGLSTGDLSGATALPCGVAVYHYEYRSVGGRGNPVTASGALMLPTGSGATCGGRRPLVEYAHGTNLNRSYDLAALGDPGNPAWSESALIAAMYAAQGYIVVAPNYVGYDTSSASYHPYLVKTEQSDDMIDGLKAARRALHRLGGDDDDQRGMPRAARPNHQLFLTGYSQGGYVALATEQAMQRRGMHVTAASPGSGPYALAAMVDYIFLGHPDLGAPSLGSLLVEAYQHSYGNVYATPQQLFTNGLYTPLPYADAAAANSSPLAANPPMFDALAPTLAQVGTLPADAGASADATLNAVFPATVPPYGSLPYLTPDNQVVAQPVWTELFDTAGKASPFAPYNAYGSAFLPLWASYFSTSGTDNLITQGYRADYLADAALNPDGLFTGTTGMPTRNASNGLREDLAANDLRGYRPKAPTMLCGGSGDPTVYYPLNTAVMQSEWGQPTNTLFSLDVDPYSAAETSGPSAAFADVQHAFQAWKAGEASPLAELESYHGTVGVYCALAARQFFSSFR